MKDLHFSYDQQADVLYIAFDKGRKASSVSLNDNLLLRFDAQTGEAVGLTVLDFSRLMREPGTLSLSRLDEFPAELQKLVWKILKSPPVNHYLRVISPTEDQRPAADLPRGRLLMAREFSLADLLLPA
jgi:uncharacterized protein YuzE